MKFAIDKNILLEALTNVTRAIGVRMTIPILNGIKFDLTSKGLSLFASDSELSIRINIPQKEIKKIEVEGSIIISSKFILDIIRKMPAEIVSFELTDDNQIEIYTDKNKYKLNCYNLADYPNISLDESKEPIILKDEVFKSIINETSFAVSTQEARLLFTGVNLKIAGNSLECIATDSYRLAKKTVILETMVSSPINVIIPGRSINELEKILDTTGDDVIMHTFSNKILFKYKNIEFQTNLLSGQYPDTNHFIPNEFTYIINLSLKDFNDAVDRATLLSQNKDKNIVRIEVDDKIMNISSSASEIGVTDEVINIDGNNKEKLAIAFSSKYMLEALKVIKDNNILLLMNTDDKPIVIKSSLDESLIQLILPVKTY